MKLVARKFRKTLWRSVGSIVPSSLKSTPMVLSMSRIAVRLASASDQVSGDAFTVLRVSVGSTKLIMVVLLCLGSLVNLDTYGVFCRRYARSRDQPPTSF